MGKQSLSALVVGAIFGFGLCLSQMINPAVVVGFLDVTGQWDPRLLFVMMGALSVTLLSFPFIIKSGKPLCDTKLSLPTNKSIDMPLVLGSVLFGLGWGLGGVCPGPAVTALAFGIAETFIFFAALCLGMSMFALTNKVINHNRN